MLHCCVCVFKQIIFIHLIKKLEMSLIVGEVFPQTQCPHGINLKELVATEEQ